MTTGDAASRRSRLPRRPAPIAGVANLAGRLRPTSRRGALARAPSAATSRRSGASLRVCWMVSVPIRVDSTDRVWACSPSAICSTKTARRSWRSSPAPKSRSPRTAWCRPRRLGPDSYPALNGLPPAADSTHDRHRRRRVRRAGAAARHPETAGRPASAMVMRSRTARMRTLAAIQAFLVALAIGSVLMAVALSYWVARTVTRPLAAITDHMRQVAQERRPHQQSRAPPARRLGRRRCPGAGDDVQQLTDAITRFQREATQRERLSRWAACPR